MGDGRKQTARVLLKTLALSGMLALPPAQVGAEEEWTCFSWPTCNTWRICTGASAAWTSTCGIACYNSQGSTVGSAICS